MLSVNNATTWENYFKELLIKNCNIKIYANDGTLLLDKSNISAFHLTSRNSYVCERVPTTDCQIEIINWSSLPAQTRSYFQQNKAVVKIAYVVEGDETTTCQTLLTKTCEVDRKGWGASITLQSVFNYYDTAVVGVDNLWASIVSAYPVEGVYPINITLAELLQNYAIYSVQGLFIKNYAKTTSIDLTSTTVWNFKYFNINAEVVDGYYSASNIFDDWTDTYEDKKSGLVAVGIDAGTDTVLYTDIKTSQAGAMISTYNYERETYISSVTVTVGGSVTSSHSELKYVSAITSILTAIPTSLPVKYEFNGYYAQLSQLPLNTKNYIQSYTFFTGSTRANKIQSDIQNYYDCNEIVEFKGRIDPRFQPLDIISVYGDLNDYIIIEEITIDYNGGFTGKITGRVIEY